MEWLNCHRLIKPRRYDLAVKWRFFQNLDDSDSMRLYCWHIETRMATNAVQGIGMDSNKLWINEYVQKCHELHRSMCRRGFDPTYAIPIDPDENLLGGAHRLACAIALGFVSVPVNRKSQMAWAPAWDRDWFVNAGLDESDLLKLDVDWAGLAGDIANCSRPCFL